MAVCIGAIRCHMNFLGSSEWNLRSWVRHLYREHPFYHPAILGQSILMVQSLSVIFKTFRVIIRIYPKEFQKGGGHTKNIKKQIQTLCANTDPLYTIVH